MTSVVAVECGHVLRLGRAHGVLRCCNGNGGRTRTDRGHRALIGARGVLALTNRPLLEENDPPLAPFVPPFVGFRSFRQRTTS